MTIGLKECDMASSNFFHNLATHPGSTLQMHDVLSRLAISYLVQGDKCQQGDELWDSVHIADSDFQFTTGIMLNCTTFCGSAKLYWKMPSSLVNIST